MARTRKIVEVSGAAEKPAFAHLERKARAAKILEHIDSAKERKSGLTIIDFSHEALIADLSRARAGG